MATDDRREAARRPRPSTSHDVASLAGVSQATVSRALRDCTHVGKETRRRVQAAAAELGYRPNVAAVRMRGARSNTIAVVLLSAPHAGRASLNPFYYDLLGAIEAEATRRKLSLILSYQGEPDTLRCDFEQRGEADGVIVIGNATNRAAWRYFGAAYKAGSHIVAWGAPDDSLPTVRADNVQGAMLAVDHLIARGCTRIAFIGPGWADQRAFHARRAGYLAALERHGLDPIEGDVPLERDRLRQGAAAVDALCDSGTAFDAIFAASDGLALGAARRVRELGRRVPEDVAVIGFDGGWHSRDNDPALTTIEQDIVQASVMLVAVIADRAVDGDMPVGVRLVTRASA